MLKFRTTNQFEKDYKKVLKRGKDEKKITTIMRKLINQEHLEPRHKEHNLRGNYIGRRECHIEPDWLLIYKIAGNEIIFERTGHHADLFG
jgi:mRNA interferase YafQ